MPENLRIDVQRDLSEAGRALILPIITRLSELESLWVSSGDEVAYQQWRRLLPRANAIIDEHYVGPNAE